MHETPGTRVDGPRSQLFLHYLTRCASLMVPRCVKYMRTIIDNSCSIILAAFCALAPLAFKATPRGFWWVQGQGTLPEAQTGNAGVYG